MNRQKLTFVAVLLIGLTAMVNAAQFKMNLYFTGEDSGIPTVSYNYTPTAISGTMESFDDTVQKIINRDILYILVNNIYNNSKNDPNQSDEIEINQAQIYK